MLFICLVLFLSACSKNNVMQVNGPTSAFTPSVEVTQVTNVTLTPTTTEILEITLTDPSVVIQNCNQFIADFNLKVKTTNWIKYVYEIEYFNNMTKEYQDPQIKEEWYRFSEDGKLVEAYNWVSTSTGEVQQEAFFYNGSFYNVDDINASGESVRPREKNYQVDFTGNFAALLKNGENQKQETVTNHGVEVWKFSYEIEEEGIHTSQVLYINKETGLIAGKETYEIATDQSLKLVSGIIVKDFDTDAEPPIQHFQEILQKAHDQNIGPYAQ